MYTYTYITYMYVCMYIYIHTHIHICNIYYTHIHPQCNAHNSTSGLNTVVLQDLLLIRAVPMSSQTAKKLLSTD